MLGIATDGYYTPVTPVVVVAGGAPPPCPDPVEIEELKPEISTDARSLIPQIGSTSSDEC